MGDVMENNKKIPTHKMVRELPYWAKIVRVVNDISIYNMNVYDNIMSWNQHNLEVPAIDYFGNVITFGELPTHVKTYVNGLKSLGIKENDVITLCMPVSTENILALLASSNLGTISNSPNFLFLRNDFHTYTDRKNSKTLIILDAYLPFVIDSLESSNVKNVIITSLSDYLLEEKKHIFDDISKLPKKLQEIFGDYEKQKECLKKMAKLRKINFIRMQELIEVGKKINEELISKPVDIDRDVSYSYTSGTTKGVPKCIVYKEMSANALIELHIGVNTKDYVGERVFQVIPLTHATGERFCGYLQMARGKTMVPQPIYNKNSFGIDVMNSKCNWITAAPSFYLAGVAQGFIKEDAFANVTRPSSGGEPVTKSNVKLIDEWLKMNGCKVRFSIGGGAAEDGSSTICSYFMDDRTKTNETGHPVEPGIRAKIVDNDGNILGIGMRGNLHVSSPASADRYLDNEEATKERWYYDEKGIRWGVTGDIAVQNIDKSYNILGRATDSYVDKQGNTIYLFDIEYSLDKDDPIIEWEITAHKTNDNYALVGQVVLKNEAKGHESQIIEDITRKYNLDAIKIYDAFESSEVTGKRDFIKLKNDKVDYYAPYDEYNLLKISYPIGQEPIKEIVPKYLVNTNVKKLIRK